MLSQHSGDRGRRMPQIHSEVKASYLNKIKKSKPPPAYSVYLKYERVIRDF